MLVAGRGYQHLDMGWMTLEEIVNGLGAFDDEGALGMSNLLIAEELTNAPSLRARQKSGEGRHAEILDRSVSN